MSLKIVAFFNIYDIINLVKSGGIIMKNFLKSMLVTLGTLGVIAVALTILVISEQSSMSTVLKVWAYIVSNKPIQIIITAVLAIYGILCIVSIILSGNINSDAKGGVILPMQTGEVHISSQTFESIVTNVAKKYKGIKTAKVNIKLRETGVGVDLYIYVLQDTVIADITSKLQEDIKEVILKQTTVTVENVNVRIKGVYTLNEAKEV